MVQKCKFSAASIELLEKFEFPPWTSFPSPLALRKAKLVPLPWKVQNALSPPRSYLADPPPTSRPPMGPPLQQLGQKGRRAWLAWAVHDLAGAARYNVFASTIRIPRLIVNTTWIHFSLRRYTVYYRTVHYTIWDLMSVLYVDGSPLPVESV